MTLRPAPSLGDLTIVLARRAEMLRDETLVLASEMTWLIGLQDDLQKLGDGAEDEEARRHIHRLLTKGG